MNKEYKVVNGTSFDVRTNDKVIAILDNALRNRTRIRIHYGDIDTGRDWDEVYDVTGYVGRSSGSIKIPLLAYNTRSMGGVGMLDHCIVKITTSAGKHLLYQQSNYHINNNVIA